MPVYQFQHDRLISSEAFRALDVLAPEGPRCYPSIHHRSACANGPSPRPGAVTP